MQVLHTVMETDLVLVEGPDQHRPQRRAHRVPRQLRTDAQSRPAAEAVFVWARSLRDWGGGHGWEARAEGTRSTGRGCSKPQPLSCDPGRVGRKRLRRGLRGLMQQVRPRPALPSAHTHLQNLPASQHGVGWSSPVSGSRVLVSVTSHFLPSL